MIIKDKGDVFKEVRIFSKGSSNTQTSIYSKTGNLSTIDDAIVLDLLMGKSWTGCRRLF